MLSVELDEAIPAHARPCHAHKHEAALCVPEAAAVDTRPYGVSGGADGVAGYGDDRHWLQMMKGLNERSNFALLIGLVMMAYKGYCLWMNMAEEACDGYHAVVRVPLHNGRDLHSLDQR